MTTFTLYSEDWKNLVALGVKAGEVEFLEKHAEFAWVIAAYISIVPHRAWTSVLMWLDAKLNPTWYDSGHLPK